MPGPHNVVIAGGGVGGLEAALALRALAQDRVSVTMVAAERHFVYRPLSTGEPFGGASTVQAELAAVAADQGFALRHDRVGAVDLEGRRLATETGELLRFDSLVLALGARQKSALDGALTFRGPRDVDRFTAALADLEDADGGRVVFVARSGTAWTLPLYELALLTAGWAARNELDVRIAIVTPEAAPLEALGPEASDEVAELLRGHRIDLYPSTIAGEVAADGLWIPIEGRLEADLVVALPVLVGPDVAGLPRDELGFVCVDEFGRVEGTTGVYAVGDMAAHRVKQGGLAAQQADVAAACIAAEAGAPVRPEPFEPVLRALLFTGRIPRYLRHPVAAGPEAAAAESSLPWWPPHKVVGAHLAPYLATHADLLVPLDRR